MSAIQKTSIDTLLSEDTNEINKVYLGNSSKDRLNLVSSVLEQKLGKNYILLLLITAILVGILIYSLLYT